MVATLTRDMELARADLAAHGYCMIRDALSPEELSNYRDALDTAARGSGAVGNLIGRDARFLDLVQHPIALEFADLLLGPEFLLSACNAIIQRPGAKAQGLHNDQAFVPPPWHHPLTYNIVWMLDDFTPENGATRVVPASHLLNVVPTRGIRTFDAWLKEPQFTAPLGDEIAMAAPAGTALVMDGRLWHKAGANITSDVRRRGVQTYFCRPHIRQQTVFFLSLKDELIARIKVDPLLRRMFGYDTYYGVIGVIDLPREGQPSELEKIGR